MSRSLALTTLRTASSVAPSLSSSPLITAASLRPTYVNGAWRRPAVSAMQVARARKAALMAGQPWTLTERTNKRKEKPVKFKGHKAERLAGAKAAQIEQAMLDMPKRIEEYYRVQRSLRVHDTLFSRIIGTDAPETKGKKAKAAPAVPTT